MHYVKDTNHLFEVCSKLNKSKFLAIDTEFIREKTYWPKLCLIQVFNGEDKIIIDPLVKGLDLKPFFKILSNNEIVKINTCPAWFDSLTALNNFLFKFQIILHIRLVR